MAQIANGTVREYKTAVFEVISGDVLTVRTNIRTYTAQPEVFTAWAKDTPLGGIPATITVAEVTGSKEAEIVGIHYGI